MKTVKEVAELTGISVRTLHYYDEIGLLKPTKVTEAGYRLYDDKALDRLGQILVFRELDLPLADIKIIMENPILDRGILEKQRAMLMIKMNRIGHIITDLNQILKGEQKMDLSWFNEGSQRDMYKSMIEGMDDVQKQSFIEYYGSMEAWEKHLYEGFDSEQARKYYAHMGGWYGEMEPMMEEWKNIPKPDEYITLQKKVGEIQRKLANFVGSDASSDPVKELVAKADSLTKELYQLSDAKKVMLDIAKRYRESGDMHETVDFMYGDGAASFIAQAISAFYEN